MAQGLQLSLLSDHLGHPAPSLDVSTRPKETSLLLGSQAGAGLAGPGDGGGACGRSDTRLAAH